MKPHKHAELIKAWADGATIEVYQPAFDRWEEAEPAWHTSFEYRIKPEPKFVPVLSIDCLLSLAREMEYSFQNESNLEGRVWASRLIKYIREGETGGPKSAEVLK